MTACLNRCTMIFQPYTYEKIPSTLINQIELHYFRFGASLMTHYSYFEYVEAMDCFAIKTTMDVKNIYDALIPFIIVVTLLTAVINVTATLKLFTVNRTERRKSEINLFIMSLAHFFCQFSVATITVLVRLTVDDTNRESSWAQLGQLILPFGSDFLTLSSPYLLLAFSSKLRNCIVQLISKENSANMIIPSVY
uniref:Serpentine receptor class gamma n=1 Tax=Heterorhabditis bacteriophora TaxID=37862 RepID=A0A1I7X5D4_HETBA